MVSLQSPLETGRKCVAGNSVLEPECIGCSLWLHYTLWGHVIILCPPARSCQVQEAFSRSYLISKPSLPRKKNRERFMWMPYWTSATLPPGPAGRPKAQKRQPQLSIHSGSTVNIYYPPAREMTVGVPTPTQAPNLITGDQRCEFSIWFVPLKAHAEGLERWLSR